MKITSFPQNILRNVFGYEQFKPLQLEVIENVLKKRDTLAIMPTGGGKSLCYQIPALIFPGLTVVVSPLIALMKDQVEQLNELGVPALFLNSSLSPEEYRENTQRVLSGQVKLLYVAPETLLGPRLFNLLSSLALDCLTIDEAHCISEWGHDFRPEYRQIAAVRDRFPQAVCLALTATATPRVRADIQASLKFQARDEFVASFNRENLFIEITAKTDANAQTLEFLRRFPKASGIIYCFSRKQVDDLTNFLASRGFSVRPYHAGLDDQVRKQNQELFIRDDVQIIVATIAFGMGINKPNVRFILHYDLPNSLEGYYQEIGRAGRDGLPAHCLMLYRYADVHKLRFFIDQKEGAERQAAYQHLEALTRYAENMACRRGPLLDYFGEKYVADNCGMCDNCMRDQGAPEDITIPAQKFISCVKRSGERFGATHIAHILMGEQNDKILKYGHQGLSTYGIGKDLSRKQWLHIAQQLVQKGLLEQSADMYRTLNLTPKAYEALKNHEPIQGRLQPDEISSQVKKKGRKGEIDYDPTLFNLLREKRKELADAAKLPPYVIFSDRTLAEMAVFYPLSRASLLKINGVGQVKLKRYGDIFLRIIQEYCQAHQLSEKQKPGQQLEYGLPGQGTLKPRHVLVGEAYNFGQSVKALMDHFQVKRDTILDHLSRFALEGQPLRDGGDLLDTLNLPLELQQAALQAFETHGPQYLRPIFDELNGEVNYDDLKVLRLHFLSQKRK